MIGTSRSLAVFKKSPARTPRPPAYTGIAAPKPNSMLKYATPLICDAHSVLRNQPGV